MKRIMILLSVCAVFAGCCRKHETPELKPEPPAVPSEIMMEHFDELMADVETLMFEGNLADAADMLDRALNDKKYHDFTNMLFRDLLEILIEDERADEASKRFMEAIANAPDHASAGFRTMYSHYSRQDDPEALLEWMGSLVELELPVGIEQEVFYNHMDATLKHGSFDDFIATVHAYTARFDDDACRKAFPPLTRFLISRKRYSDAEKLLSALESESENRPGLRMFVAAERTHLLFAEGRWDEAEKQFQQTAGLLPDDELRRCIRLISPLAIKAGELEMLDRICESVMTNQRDKESASREAAVQYIAVGRQSDDNSEILRRLEVLMERGLPSDVLFRFLSNHYYSLIKTRDKEDIRQALAFGDKLTPLLTRESDRETMSSMSLDLHFMAENYEKALDVLKRGISSFDEEWHEMAINKLKAHIALRDGRNMEAIERFKKFMEHVATWESPEYDLINDIMHTREMSLGFNYARIGEIFASMGQAKEANEAYNKAREYYEHALAETDEDKNEYAHIQKALAKLPGPEPVEQPVPAPPVPESEQDSKDMEQDPE